MREIKFRAWNKEKKMWCSDEHEADYPDDEVGFILKGDRPETVLMQFTGLLDKNGKEIYEGDILRSRESNEVFQVDDIIPLHRHTHVTNIGYFVTDGKKEKYERRLNPAAQYDNADDWMSWPEMYEIIGNIYSNPELLSNPQ